MSTVNVAKFDDLVDGSGTAVEVGEDRIAIFRVGDEVHAIADRCSHAEASLAEGELFGTEVECPRHGAEFDITTGAALTLPATKPVVAYPAEVVDGEVQITIGGTDA
jgi:3-phenylpropionate/trans-cinnamate dioxygenase ferredoxin subunit